MPFPLDIQFIKGAEERLGRSLPHAYKARMLRENGGDLLAGTDSWQLFPILDDSEATAGSDILFSLAVRDGSGPRASRP